MDNNGSGTNEREDDQWLDAIAGRPDPNADAKLNREAAALRAALIARRQEIESSVPEADDALLEKIRFRLRREGFDRSETDSADGQRAVANWRVGRGSISLPDGVTIDDIPAFLRKNQTRKSRNYRAWGMAASVLIGFALIVQLGINPSRNSEDDVVRGDAASTNLIVDDPQARLIELLSGLKAAGLEPNVKQLDDDRVLLKIVANDASREYLLSQRIEGKEKDGMIVLLLSKKPTK